MNTDGDNRAGGVASPVRLPVLRPRAVPRPRVIATLILVQALFGTLPLAGQLVMRWVPPVGTAALRATGAAIVFALLVRRRLASVALRDVPLLLLFSVLAIIGNQILFLEGLSRTSQINASVLITTIPVFTVGFALALRRETASLARLGGVAVGLCGALLLARVEHFHLGNRGVLGNLMVVANCSLWSLYLVLARPVLRRIPPLVMTAWLFLIGAVVMAPLGLPSAVDGLARAPLEGWLAAAWVVIFPTIVAYLLNTWALREAESSQVAIFTYLQPVVAGILAWAFAGETLDLRTGIAAALIFVGVALVQVDGLPSQGKKPQMNTDEHR